MTIEDRMQEHLDNLTKPRGSLGDLEQIALRLAGIQNRVPPDIRKKAVYVFAADHGITDEKVSLYPKDVTYQMVLNFLNQGAAINVLARHLAYDVSVVDCGVAQPIDDERVIDCRGGSGTRNFAREPAMSAEQLDACLSGGARLAASAVERGYDLIAVGDMGIGNTSTAAALLIACGFEPTSVVDRGTGISDEDLVKKQEIIERAVALHAPFSDPKDILCKVGGFEFATMAGFILGLKGRSVACVIDGFPVSAAAYMACRLDPQITSYLFAGHKSKVKGHAAILSELQLTPLLDLRMRLGEGTGAVLGGQLVYLAAKLAGEMASFQSAQVSRSETVEEDY